MKKLLSILLAAALVCSLSAAALADFGSEAGSIAASGFVELDGALYVADSYAGAVWRVYGSSLKLVAGGSGSGYADGGAGDAVFSGPWALAPFPDGLPKRACDGPYTPGALYWGPRMLYERYRLPLLITENGMSCHDAVMLDGKVHDPNRIDYVHRYLLAVRRAVEDGVPVKGYFYWSFFDNFEWARGYTERFGLTYVNYQTQERIPKDSAYWYQRVMDTNGAEL